MSSTHVLKFGGTSLRSVDLINQAADIIADRYTSTHPAVVVSAVGGVTNQLVRLASGGNSVDENLRIIRKLKKQHLQLLSGLEINNETARQDMKILFEDLEAAFIERKKYSESPAAWRDELLSFGERASVRLMEAALRKQKIPAQKIETQYLIKTDASFGEANVCSEATRKKVQESLPSSDIVPVITGFIGSAPSGDITTLGRSGSDYTASLIAEALCAELLEIWTDVNGVLTADPNVVPEAQSIDKLNYDDIAELSAHGARVLHPKTIDPLRKCSIPVQVRNSLNPSHPGTKISKEFSSNGSFHSVTVTGPFHYVEIPGYLQSSFYALLHESLPAAALTNIYSRTAPSELARFVIPKEAYCNNEKIISDWFENNNIDDRSTKNLYWVKKFANALLKHDDVTGHIINRLSRLQIKPIEWYRGHNQRHISLLLRKNDVSPAMNMIDAMRADDAKKIQLFVAGTGEVGGTLIKQINALVQQSTKICIIGTCNTERVTWNSAAGATDEQPTDWAAIIARLRKENHGTTIFVDATGSKEVAKLYPKLSEADISVVTPSKLANTFDQTYYDFLRDCFAKHNVNFRYEATVGAGLPVLTTIKRLQKSEDRIYEISGAVSGTMTYLFAQLEEGVPFSKAIVDARAKGYAEPDPRDDLSGEDTARKFLTLAREIGLKVERSDIKVQSLIPEDLRTLDSDEFLDKLPEYDQYWTDRLAEALKSDATLRYLGQIVDGDIQIGVQRVPVQSPLGQLKGTDNLIRIFSDYYSESPVIIQGPGAGKNVTAAGVLTDVLEVTDTLF